MYRNFLKRILDFTASLFGLIILSPIFLIVTIGLFFANGGKPFFFQRRPGKDGKIFNIIKFKTMNDRKDSQGKLLPDADRLTKIGAFVRKTSLDEIPQLINVVKGEMSLIGPRPLLPEYLSLYNDTQRRRNEVRPGITGWAQVMYPYGAGVEDAKQKLMYDLYYIKHYSIWLDIKIIYKTILVVLGKKGL